MFFFFFPASEEEKEEGGRMGLISARSIDERKSVNQYCLDVLYQKWDQKQ